MRANSRISLPWYCTMVQEYSCIIEIRTKINLLNEELKSSGFSPTGITRCSSGSASQILPLGRIRVRTAVGHSIFCLRGLFFFFLFAIGESHFAERPARGQPRAQPRPCGAHGRASPRPPLALGKEAAAASYPVVWVTPAYAASPKNGVEHPALETEVVGRSRGGAPAPPCQQVA